MALTRSSEWNRELALKRARQLLAEYATIVAGVDEQLADPEDLRPVGAQQIRERNLRIGIPVTRVRFDRAAAERAREELSEMLVAAHQNTLAPSRR